MSGVCQLAYFLTDIRHILVYILFLMIYLSEIFWRQSQDVCTLFQNNQKFHACLSVHQLAYLHDEIRPIQGYLLSWMRYLSEIVWKHSWDLFTLFQNKCKLLLCLSVCQSAYFLTYIRQMQAYLLFCLIYLPEICLTHFWNVCTLFPNICIFLVCLSVCQLAYFGTDSRPTWGYLLSLVRYISDFFGEIPEMYVHFYQIITNFLYVCQSISWIIYQLKLGKYRDISYFR